MIQQLQSKDIIVTRNGTPQPAKTIHDLYLDVRDPQGNIVGVGDFLGTAVELRTGHVVYAQTEQMVDA